MKLQSFLVVCQMSVINLNLTQENYDEGNKFDSNFEHSNFAR